MAGSLSGVVMEVEGNTLGPSESNSQASGTNPHAKQDKDTPKKKTANTFSPSWDPNVPFALEFHRKMQSLFIYQALIVFCLFFHSVLLICLSGWQSKNLFYVGHWTHLSHPAIELLHAVNNLVLFGVLMYVSTRKWGDLFNTTNDHQWPSHLRTRIRRFDYWLSLLCFFDGSLLFYTDGIFLLFTGVVFILRFSQIYLVGALKILVSHHVSTKVVEQLLDRRYKETPKTLVSLFNLRKMAVRASVLWSFGLTLYNMLSNTYWLVGGHESGFASLAAQEGLLEQMQNIYVANALNVTAPFTHWEEGPTPAPKIKVFHWHQGFIPDPAWWSLESDHRRLECLPVSHLLPEPVSVLNSLGCIVVWETA